MTFPYKDTIEQDVNNHFHQLSGSDDPHYRKEFLTFLSNLNCSFQIRFQILPQFLLVSD